MRLHTKIVLVNLNEHFHVKSCEIVQYYVNF